MQSNENERNMNDIERRGGRVTEKSIEHISEGLRKVFSKVRERAGWT